jgi:uncharacterized DUF497 family protein
MRFGEPDFLWDDDDDPNGNVAHIAEHGVTPTEAEDAILDRWRVAATVRRVPGQQRRRAIVGGTRNGRILLVVYVVREGAFRVITAYDAGDEKSRYRRHRRR